MKQFTKTHKTPLLLILFTFIGSFLRFYNLNWGAPFYFHPDERNIASSIAQLNFPGQMNPHFFAYGSFPIYIIYFLGILLNLLSQITMHHGFSFTIDMLSVSFEKAIIISRFLSAFLSTLIIPLIYFLGKKLGGKTVGFLSMSFTTISVGFIQFAHFGTFEIWLTFLTLLLFYFCLKMMEKISTKNLVISAIILGLLIGTKVSSLALLPIPLFSAFKNPSRYKKFINLFLLVLIATAIVFLTSPFFILDLQSFRSSIQYEASVALGTLPVFYTGEFFNSIPVVFQFTKVYPFLLNPILAVLFIPSFIYIAYQSFKKRVKTYYLLFTICYLLFFSQAFFLAKWTRYMVPTLPFIYLIVAITISDLLGFTTKASSIKYFVSSMIFFIFSIFTFSYFVTAYTKPDARIQAALWAKENIPKEAKILSEIYDMGIVPFNSYFGHITLFNFYDLDQAPQKNQELLSDFNNYDYLVLPSQRILKSRLLHPKKFPVGYDFYKRVFEEIGFKKIHETPCDIFCKIVYLNDPVFAFEETANVFDRPSISIFKINQ